jgi:hypothetical protein
MQVDAAIQHDLVSVIIPVHNRFELAERAIRSVAAQNYRSVEIIVVDDASSEPFGFPREQATAFLEWSVVRMKSNAGPGAARESGRKCARGEFIAYLDSDDWWSPHYLMEMTRALRQNPEAGMAYCIAVQESSSGSRSVRRRSDESFISILPTVLYGRPWHTSGCLWRSSATGLAAPWEALWSWEDYLHDVRAGCSGVSLAHVKEQLCFVQQDGDDRLSNRGNSRNSRRGQQSMAQALRMIAAAISRTGWAANPETQHRLGHLTLTHAINSLELDLREEALSLTMLAKLWGVGNSDFSLNLGRTFASAGMRSMALRMWRHCRRRFLDRSPTQANS